VFSDHSSHCYQASSKTYLPYYFSQEGRRTGGFFVGCVIINSMREEGFKKISLWAGLLLLIALLFFLLASRVWFTKALGFFSKPIASVEKILLESYRQNTAWTTYFTTIKTKDQQIFQLQGQLNQLAIEKNQLSSCLEENDKIKKLLGSPLPAQWQFMEAKVLGISEVMKIDKGQKDGINEGMMVISENILVGKIIKVNENDALVQLLSDSNTKIPVLVKKPGPDKIQPTGGVQARGLLFGQGGEKLLLDRVLQAEDIQKGDLVITSGEENWRPDLLIGQIIDVAPKSAEVYQKARVSPLVESSKLRIVFVVVK
jgi:rod shape-determining protein MreC